jgi:hypothetical protein
MSQTLPGIGTISYNGYTFYGPRVRTTLRVTPRYGSDGRTVIYNVFEIMVRFVLTSDPLGQQGGLPTDGNMVAALSALNQPGGTLLFNGLGYGPYNINTGLNPTDVVYGPKPRVVSAEPMGSNLAMRVTWTCEVALVACGITGGIEGFQGQLLELTYTNDWTIDQAGLTVIVIRGHVQIGLNRSLPGSPNIVYTADMNRELIAPTPPLQFRVRSQNWFLSEDKSRDDFTFTFEEIAGDNALPTYVSDLQVDHTIAMTRAKGMHIVPSFVISGFVEVVKPQNIEAGFAKVCTIINERLTNARNQGRMILVTSLRITEPIFNSRRVSFELAYITTVATDNGKAVKPDQQMFANVFIQGAMFTTVGSTDWNSWRGSMLESAWGPRGYYGGGIDPGNDSIVDQCNQAIPNLTLADGVPTGNIAQIDPGNPNNDPNTQGYIYYDGHLSIRTYKNANTHYPLPTQSPPNSGGGGSGGSGNPPALTLSNQQAPYAAQLDSTLPAPLQQISGQKPVEIVLSGTSVRINAPPELPSIAMAFGQTPAYQTDDSDIEHVSFPEYYGATVYAAAWDIVYTVGLDAQQIQQVASGDFSQLTLGTQSDS